MKKFFAFLMALLLCVSTAVPAFAAGIEEVPAKDDGIVVYEDDSIIVYDAREGAYDNVWLWPSDSSSGSFNVTTSLKGTIGMTLAIADDTKKASATITVRKPGGILYGNEITLNFLRDGANERAFKMANTKAGTYTIEYLVYNPNGMRIMCWIYDV